MWKYIIIALISIILIFVVVFFSSACKIYSERCKSEEIYDDKTQEGK